MTKIPYYPVSEYYKDTYKEKIYKLPIKLTLTCPNRDGQAGYGGCIFCSESGGSFENLPSYMTVSDQLDTNRAYIGKRYKANKFIAYFQNFSNTYMSLDDFKEVVKACDKDYIVGIAISTRSDCISTDKLEFLKDFREKTGIDITIELGLQTANYRTLDILNRGESLADFIWAVTEINKYDFRVCAHLILSLPWDDDRDIIESARILNALGVKEVKLHSLYVVKGTKLADMYADDKIQMISKREYQKNVITFLRYIDEDTAIARLLGRAPEDETIFCNWDSSWWSIRDEIISYMDDRQIKQGDKSKRKKFDKIKGE